MSENSSISDRQSIGGEVEGPRLNRNGQDMGICIRSLPLRSSGRFLGSQFNGSKVEVIYFNIDDFKNIYIYILPIF